MQEPEKALVPAMVGLSLADASELATTARVSIELILGAAPARSTVVAQQPQAGTQVEPGSTVQLSVDDPDHGAGGGGARLQPPPLLDPEDPTAAGEPTVV